METLKRMKECLVSKVEGQIYGNIEAVSAEELGAAIDMIKDLSEAEYYCSIVKSMEESAEKDEGGRGSHKGTMYYSPRVMPYEYPIAYYDPRYREKPDHTVMYADGRGTGTSTNGGSGNSSMYHDGTMYPDSISHVYRDGMMKDPREGRAGMRRKMYMEGKGMKDKNKQMQELESYMQELASDITEMIQDASAEEKQLLQNKISALAAKVK